LEKEVAQVRFYDSIGEMLEHLPLEEIMPTASGIEEAKKIYYSFPDYKKKIKEYGIAVYELK